MEKDIVSSIRHKWSGQVENSLTFSIGDIVEQQQCLKCGIYRYKALNMWHYTKEKVTNENMFPKRFHNKGCIIK